MMTPLYHLSPIVLGIVLFTPPAFGQNTASNPCDPHSDNPCSEKKQTNPCTDKHAHKKELIPVNPCHAKRGTVFYIADPMKRDTITFNSRAPLEDIVGQTHTATGYIVFDPRYPTMGMRASFRVPAQSLETGIPLRDEHLRGDGWLEADLYPAIAFTVQDTKDVFLVKESPAFRTYNMTLMGPFSLHGRTVPIKVPARVTFMKESEKTKMKMPGDLCAIRANFEIRLKTFGINGPPGMDLIGSKVGETIEIHVSLFASSEVPKTDNPCGTKASNPCNPCTDKNSNNPNL